MFEEIERKYINNFCCFFSFIKTKKKNTSKITLPLVTKQYIIIKIAFKILHILKYLNVFTCLETLLFIYCIIFDNIKFNKRCIKQSFLFKKKYMYIFFYIFIHNYLFNRKYIIIHVNKEYIQILLPRSSPTNPP